MLFKIKGGPCSLGYWYLVTVVWYSKDRWGLDNLDGCLLLELEPLCEKYNQIVRIWSVLISIVRPEEA